LGAKVNSKRPAGCLASKGVGFLGDMRGMVEDHLDHVCDVKLHQAAVEMDEIMATMPLLHQRMDFPGIREIDVCD
jgi:hypothetical protein